MRSITRTAFVGAVGLLLALPTPQEVDAQSIEAWAALPESLPPYTPPNKPLTKISDLVEKHGSELSWSEVVFTDHIWHASYISMAPGESTVPRFYQDHVVWFVVQEGQIRFDIEGQDPFVASERFFVQVPKRLVFSMETVGSQRALLFQMEMANGGRLYPVDETPPDVPDVTYQRVTVANAKGSYTDAQPVYVDFNRIISGEMERPGALIPSSHDDPEAGFTNIGNLHIGRGEGADPNSPTGGPGEGHLHMGSPEAWFVIEGQIEGRFGHLPPIVAEEGDILYVPAGWVHNLRPIGPGYGTRLPIVAYANSHVRPQYPETEGETEEE